ncbi:MAG: alpha/beta hydrolase [Chloroflexota bacterium]
MKILQSSWQDKEGITFHAQSWEPDARPTAVVALLHGLGEHIARYAVFAEALVKAGYAVIGFDLRGHGRSGGRRGHTPSYEALLDDIDTLLVRVKGRYPRQPVFLYGHSLGGALAINYVLRRAPRIQGVIATAPWLRTVIEAPPLKAALARILEPILPTYTERWAQEPTELSQDPAVASAFARDPLRHNLISARMYRACTQAGEWALEHAAEFRLPLLLMHGTADSLTSWEASQEFARRLGRKVTWRLWDGWYHELHNEPERRRVVQTIIAWMNRKLENRRSARPPAGQMRPGMRKSRPILNPGA